MLDLRLTNLDPAFWAFLPRPIVALLAARLILSKSVDLGLAPTCSWMV